MCDYLSLVVTKGGKALWLPRNPLDHEDVISEYKLNDTRLVNRTWIRVEISPADRRRPTRDRKDWSLKVDEEGTLPEWWRENPDKYTGLAWAAWEESVKVNIAINEDRGQIKDLYLILLENSSVVARRNSSVVARRNSSVEARRNSSVEAWENSSVEAWENSSVVARGNSSVVARGNSSVVAWENSSVKLYPTAKAKLQSPLATAVKDGKLYVKSLDGVIAASEVE